MPRSPKGYNDRRFVYVRRHYRNGYPVRGHYRSEWPSAYKRIASGISGIGAVIVILLSAGAFIFGIHSDVLLNVLFIILPGIAISTSTVIRTITVEALRSFRKETDIKFEDVDVINDDSHIGENG